MGQPLLTVGRVELEAERPCVQRASRSSLPSRDLGKRLRTLPLSQGCVGLAKKLEVSNHLMGKNRMNFLTNPVYVLEAKNQYFLVFEACYNVAPM